MTNLQILECTVAANGHHRKENLLFPTSITQLLYGGPAIPLQSILERFPNVKKLAFHYCYRRNAQSVMTKPNPFREHGKLC